MRSTPQNTARADDRDGIGASETSIKNIQTADDIYLFAKVVQSLCHSWIQPINFVSSQYCVPLPSFRDACISNVRHFDSLGQHAYVGPPICHVFDCPYPSQLEDFPFPGTSPYSQDISSYLLQNIPYILLISTSSAK